MTENKTEFVAEEIVRPIEIPDSQEPVTKKKNKKALLISLIAVGTAVLIAVALILGIPYIKYRQTIEMMENGQYAEAIAEFEGMGDYLKSEELLIECKYLLAKKTQGEGKYVEAAEMFTGLGEYKDSRNLITECKYLHACDVLTAKDYQKAMELFGELQGYKNSADKILECKYQLAVKLIDDGKIVLAYNEFTALGEYKDCAELLKSIEETYQMIMAKPKIFVNAQWENADRIRIWLTTKVIDDNTLKITVDGSDGGFDHSTEELTGKWNESTGKVEFSGKSYRTYGDVNDDGEYVERTDCVNENVTGCLYYKNGRVYLVYDNIDLGYISKFIR